MSLKLNYTSYDFNTIKTDLITKLAQEDVFKDYNFAGSQINTLVELISAVGDLFGFYLNMTATESFIGTATLYENLNKLSQMVGYKASGYKSAEVNLNLITKPATYDLTSKNNYKISIPRFSKFTCSESTEAGESIFFTNTEEAIWIIDTDTLSLPTSAATITFTVPLVQGTPLSVGNELTYTADGSTYQQYEITEPKALEEYLIVTVDDIEWTKVDSLYTDTDGANIYTSRYNKDKRVEIQFGNGTNGAKPSIGSVIKIRYITSLGFDGNINANIVNGITDSIYETNTAGVTVAVNSSNFTFSQPEISAGGSDPETEEELREKAPAYARTQNRIVTKKDYEDLILANFNEYVYKCKALKYEEVFDNTTKLNQKLTESQIIETKALLSSYGLTVPEIENVIYASSQTNRAIFYNNIYILIVPKFGESITTTLRNKLDLFLENYKLLTINHVYLDAIFVPINVTVSYTKVATTLRTITEIEMTIREILTEYFRRSNRDVGELIKHGDLVALLKEVDGVDSIILDLIRSDSAVGTETNANIQLGKPEFPILGTVTLVKE